MHIGLILQPSLRLLNPPLYQHITIPNVKEFEDIVSLPGASQAESILPFHQHNSVESPLKNNIRGAHVPVFFHQTYRYKT